MQGIILSVVSIVKKNWTIKSKILQCLPSELPLNIMEKSNKWNWFLIS